jgi:hypothetical protein
VVKSFFMIGLQAIVYYIIIHSLTIRYESIILFSYIDKTSDPYLYSNNIHFVFVFNNIHIYLKKYENRCVKSTIRVQSIFTHVMCISTSLDEIDAFQV